MHEFSSAPTSLYDYRWGVDGISIFFIQLTTFFTYLCFLNINSDILQLSEVFFSLGVLQESVLASFSAFDLLGFFIFFEITLIPIYFLVMIWGSRERRVHASYLIAIYTLLGSIFMFFNILYLFSKTGTSDYTLLLNINFPLEDQLFI